MSNPNKSPKNRPNNTDIGLTGTVIGKDSDGNTTEITVKNSFAGELQKQRIITHKEFNRIDGNGPGVQRTADIANAVAAAQKRRESSKEKFC